MKLGRSSHSVGSPWSHGLWPKKLYSSVEVTPVPCPEFHIGSRLAWELFTLPYAAANVYGAMGCDQKNFIILVVWRWHQLLSKSLPNCCLSWVSCRLGQELFTLPLYLLQFIRNMFSKVFCLHFISSMKKKKKKKNWKYDFLGSK